MPNGPSFFNISMLSIPMQRLNCKYMTISDSHGFCQDFAKQNIAVVHPRQRVKCHPPFHCHAILGKISTM